MFKIRGLLPFCLLFSSCSVLFFQDAESSAGGSWIGTDRFVEVRSEFERKSHWVALNQNAITRNYRTTLILHSVKNGAAEKSTPIAHYKGWTLGDSLFLAGERLIAVRGQSDSPGDFDREMISAALAGSGEAKTIYRATETILSAVPSPDGSLIAVFLTDATTENRTGNLFVELHEFSGNELSRKSRTDLKWPGVPGNPELSWARDSRGIFLHLEDSVQFVSAGGSVARADRFPVCFIPTSSGRTISDNGTFFTRSQDGSIELQKQDVVPFAAVPMTGTLSELGNGCP